MMLSCCPSKFNFVFDRLVQEKIVLFLPILSYINRMAYRQILSRLPAVRKYSTEKAIFLDEKQLQSLAEGFDK